MISQRYLAHPAALTGWVTFMLLAGLAGFNLRKRLAMLPLGRASLWLKLHLLWGVLALVLFRMHTGRLWPLGLYEQVLASLFYLVSLSGIAGYSLQKLYPPLLRATGVEVIFERIPEELAKIRAEAEGVVLDCTAKTGSDTLARQYQENLDWFFRRPRFVRSHVLSGKTGKSWARERCLAVKRYLNDEERVYLERLTRLAYYKNQVDFHYAAQGVMKGWLLLHIPLSAALMTLAVWHIIVVHVYAL